MSGHSFESTAMNGGWMHSTGLWHLNGRRPLGGAIDL